MLQRKCHQSSEAVRTRLCIRCFSNQDQANVFDLWHSYKDEETSKHLICLIVIMVLVCASFLHFRGGMNVFFHFKGWARVSQVHVLFDAGRKVFLKVCHV